MKKPLLILSAVLFAGTSFAQLTQLNEPNIGNSLFMYQLDSNATWYESTTGTGVTWDYSDVLGLPGQDQTISVADATTHANYSDFTGATKVSGVAGNFENFFGSTATDRFSKGFVFNEATFGTVIAKFDVNDAVMVEYPMAVGNSFEDDFEGSLSFDFSGVPMNPTTVGVSHVTVDGSGTLNLGQGTNLTGVLRYVAVDSIYFNVSLVGDMEVIRTSYEYYHHATSNLPVFSIMNIKIQNLGATTPLVEQSVVLSSVEPNDFVGIEDLTSELIKVYPNPTEGSLTIEGLTTSETVTVFDYAGRNLKTIAGVSNGQVLDLNDLTAGPYIVTVGSAKKHIIIK